MPNHVTNVIKISGDQKQIDELLEKVKQKNEYTDEDVNSIDFEKIIPMPDNIFRGNLGKEEREKYGNNNWYDWSIDNWGTKWNAYDFVDCGENAIGFHTAWSAPFPIFEELSDQYPELVFECDYADEDIGYNCGSVTMSQGCEIKVFTPIEGSKIAVEFAEGILW